MDSKMAGKSKLSGGDGKEHPLSRCANRRERPGREAGQVLILWILMATLIFVIGAIVIDFGLWFTERRHAQTAADLAALAAATRLGNDAATIAMGMDYAERNGYDHDAAAVDVFVNPNYNGDPDLVEVKIRQDAPTMFLGIFTAGSFDIGARAVASVTEGEAVYAIFANNSDCPGSDPLIIPGSDSTITGLVHSNSDLSVSGSNNTFDGPVTYGCDFSDDGAPTNEFDPEPASSGTREPPVEYSYEDFLPCTIEYTEDTDLSSQPEVWVDFSTKTELKPGVYCSTKKLVLSGQNVTGTVTLVAGETLSISGSNFNLSPYWNNVLLFSAGTHDSAIDISASGGNWVGIINAPAGRVKLQGGEVASDSFDLYGSIVADRVTVSGSDFTITAAFVSAEDDGIRLVE